MRVTDSFMVRCDCDGVIYAMACTGAIDAAAVPAMREATLEALSSRSSVIVIDLADVSILDSAGVAAIRLAHKAAEIAGVDLQLARPRPSVVRVLQLADAEYLLASSDR